MRGLEPPRGCPHGDLNAARLPIPPHPRAASECSQRPRAAAVRPRTLQKRTSGVRFCRVGEPAGGAAPRPTRAGDPPPPPPPPPPAAAARAPPPPPPLPPRG